MDNMAPPDGSRRRDLAMVAGSLGALRGLGAQNAGAASRLTRTPTPPHRRAGAGPATALPNDRRGPRHGGRAMKRGVALWAAEGTERSLREARQDKGQRCADVDGQFPAHPPTLCRRYAELAVPVPVLVSFTSPQMYCAAAKEGLRRRRWPQGE